MHYSEEIFLMEKVASLKKMYTITDIFWHILSCPLHGVTYSILSDNLRGVLCQYSLACLWFTAC